MNTITFTQSWHARKEVLDFIEQSIPPELWKNNFVTTTAMKEAVNTHRLFKHPILNRLRKCQLSYEQLKYIHIQYFSSIVQSFTDVLSMLIYRTKELDKCSNIYSHYRTVAKIYARYLIALNLMDELGFNTHELTQSSPAKSHLCHYMNLMNQMHLQADQLNHLNAETVALNSFIEYPQHTYTDLLIILACTEQQVIQYSEVLKINLEYHQPSFIHGYYSCHGIAHHQSDHLANDDNHENDLWMLLNQSIELEDTLHYQKLQADYLELWDNFWWKMYNATL